MTSSQILGRKAESSALRYLQRQGLELIARNYTTRYGELDLVMRDQTTTVFVEVRKRKSQNFGHAAETIDWHKRKRLAMAADSWLQKNNCRGACRFDVITVDGTNDPRWIRNAFEHV